MRGEKNGFCLKRSRGRTYVSLDLAIQEAKQIFDSGSTKMFVYPCRTCNGYFHHTRKEIKAGKLARMNRKLVNYYKSNEEAERGKMSGMARQQRKKRRDFPVKTLPLHIWEGEGGAIYPSSMEP